MHYEDVDRLMILLSRAQAEYFGEAVTQLEHALQCAHLAKTHGADEELVAAALLHDIGHIVAPEEELGAVDHDRVGADYLREAGCSERLARLVGGHVSAKRYLTAVNPRYYDQLSKTSKTTLAMQGGPMTADEARTFVEDPLHEDKLRLRNWDERAKEPGVDVPDLNTYREMLLRL